MEIGSGTAPPISAWLFFFFLNVAPPPESPPFPPPPPLPSTTAPPPRHIPPHALRRRFTVVERTALEWAVVDRAEAGEADRLNAATLRSLLKDIEQARQLD